MQQKNKEKEIFKLLRYLKKYKFKIGVMVLLAISGAIVSAITVRFQDWLWIGLEEDMHKWEELARKRHKNVIKSIWY